jgi:DNA-binding HxlR family transcriptional regulator
MAATLQTRASSINRALDQIGDKWCLLILQEIFWGVNTFNELLAASGMSRGVLSQRLQWLQDIDCLKKTNNKDKTNRPAYHLTRKSNDLYPNALAAIAWERAFFNTPELDQVTLRHSLCGKEFSPIVRCRSCNNEVLSEQVSYTQGPGQSQDLREMKVRRRSSISIMDAPSNKPFYKNLIHIVGDRWTANIVALAFHGFKRFDDFHKELPVATNILADRLRFLTTEGIFEMKAYQEKPKRHDYVFTDKGRGLYPFFLGLLQWGDKWCGGESGVPIIAKHDACGFDLKARTCCDQCLQTLEAHELSFEGRQCN